MSKKMFTVNQDAHTTGVLGKSSEKCNEILVKWSGKEMHLDQDNLLP